MVNCNFALTHVNREMAQETGQSFSIMAGWILLVLFIQLAQINCQPTQGYLNIDCGLASGQSYVDNYTGLEYVSDDLFVETGQIYNISESYINPDVDKPHVSLRSFPNETRNCYTLKPTTPSNKYLIRAGFRYGNYDGLNNANTSSPITFDLYIGPNLWVTLYIDSASDQYRFELITVAKNNFMSICLVNIGKGTPFISLIEMRLLKTKIYPAAISSQSLSFLNRSYMAPNTSLNIRYPDDPYDRIWRPWMDTSWSHISTTDKVTFSSNDMFEVPSLVLQNAATSTSIKFQGLAPNIYQCYVFLHFAEIQNVSSGTRSFYAYINGFPLIDGPFSPSYLMSRAVYNTKPYGSIGTVSIEAASTSKYDPILNAFELYSLVTHEEVETNSKDYDAMMAIKTNYFVKKNWMGDPCSPKNFSWDGVGCNYTGSAPTISSLDLSSSGLRGSISDLFAKLESIQTLNLSNNQLSGDVPDSLAVMPSLHVLDLTGNCLNKVPKALRQKSADKTLLIRFEPQTKGCVAPDNHKKITSITVAIASVITVSMLVALIICIRKRRLTAMVTHLVQRPSPTFKGARQEMTLMEMNQATRFTKSQLEKIIQVYNKRIGGGGFGEVFYGKLENNTEVAIKVLSKTSSQGYKEFKKEVEALSAVYHENIVRFIGYCEEEECLALVYEYMLNRSLADQLHGSSLPSALNWDTKLKIAHGAAQGLEYLHTGCKMVHRDVKSANILLDQNFEAKLSDFGMSRIFDESTITMTQSTVGGTFGYLDPEVLTGSAKKLSFPSDVYSFGVVLLEMVTGQPPFSPKRGSLHIVDYVSQNPTIVDPTIGEYDPDSMRMVMDLAMRCTKGVSNDRPTMSYVVMELERCLNLGKTRQWSMGKTISSEMSNRHDQVGHF